MRKLRFLSIVLVPLLLAACRPQAAAEEIVPATGGSYKNISADQLNTMLMNKDFVLINVHIPFAGNITKTDLSIPYDEIEQNLSRLPTDKSAKIVLYCRSGRMSANAAETLVQLGYTNVLNLKDGMVGWEQAGYEIEK